MLFPKDTRVGIYSQLARWLSHVKKYTTPRIEVKIEPGNSARELFGMVKT